jgi:hypothetical protein
MTIRMSLFIVSVWPLRAPAADPSAVLSKTVKRVNTEPGRGCERAG